MGLPSWLAEVSQSSEEQQQRQQRVEGPQFGGRAHARYIKDLRFKLWHLWQRPKGKDDVKDHCLNRP